MRIQLPSGVTRETQCVQGRWHVYERPPRCASCGHRTDVLTRCRHGFPEEGFATEGEADAAMRRMG